LCFFSQSLFFTYSGSQNSIHLKPQISILHRNSRHHSKSGVTYKHVKVKSPVCACVWAWTAFVYENYYLAYTRFSFHKQLLSKQQYWDFRLNYNWISLFYKSDHPCETSGAWETWISLLPVSKLFCFFNQGNIRKKFCELKIFLGKLWWMKKNGKIAI